jgi:hypothetical protein
VAIKLAFQPASAAVFYILLLSPFCCASAQTIDMSGFVNSINLQASQSFSDMIGESIYEESSKNSNRATSQQSRSNILNPAILVYRTSLSSRQRNLKNFVNKTRASDPAGASKMQELFASTDVIAAMEKGIAPYGLRVDNLADAYTVYWVNAWLGSRGRTDSLSKQEIGAVRKQAVNALSGTKEIALANDLQKQEFAEALLIQAALIDSYVNDAKSNIAKMNKVKAAIAQGAKAMGLDLYTMTLTDNGFVPAKKGSAIDGGVLVPDDEAEEQALASTAPPPWYDSTNYTLIAAAGGAGLGGMFLLGKVMGRKS